MSTGIISCSIIIKLAGYSSFQSHDKMVPCCPLGSFVCVHILLRQAEYPLSSCYIDFLAPNLRHSFFFFPILKTPSIFPILWEKKKPLLIPFLSFICSIFFSFISFLQP